MNRRRFVATLGLGAVASLASVGAGRAQVTQSIAGVIPPDHPLQASWRLWKGRCLESDGRVIDDFQNSDSHSESQSYGLTLAAAFDDLEAFEAIRIWTEENLAIRSDALFAWRWRHDQRPRVPDRNNASDGDLFFAWALAAMAQRHDKPMLLQRAQDIAVDLARLCVVPHPDGRGQHLFMPAEQGFATETGVIVNPSYSMPRAMRDLAAASGVRLLAKVAEDGIALMDQMAATGLVPDWAEVTATGWAAPPERFSANAGYEAMRVPLFAVWSGEPDAPAVRRYVAAAVTDTSGPAATVFDRATGRVLESSTHSGYHAIAALSACAGSAGFGAAIPPFSVDQPYYPATLHLMALVAQAELYPRCVPI